MTRSASNDAARSDLFTRGELARVGTATALLAVLGTVVIVGITIALGHYSSITHAGPKAVVVGLSIGLLLAGGARFRCVALLGVVYGLILLAQIGVVYLVPVMALAGFLGGGVGRLIAPVGRRGAIFAAAVAFDLVSSCGAPVKILLATEGRTEPFLWGLWLAEWPLRIAGASLGVVLAMRWHARHAAAPAPAPMKTAAAPRPALQRRGVAHAGLMLLASIAAVVVPSLLTSWTSLAVVAGFYLLLGLRLGLRRQFVAILGSLAWGYLVFALLSYAWHRDLAIVIDLLRSFVLRFMPMAVTSVLLVQSVRPLDLLRLLRRLRLPPVTLLPLAGVLRTLPLARGAVLAGIERLGQHGIRPTPLHLLRNPVLATRELVSPMLAIYVHRLARPG